MAETDATGRPAETNTPARIPVYLNWDANCLVLSPESIHELVADAKWAGVDGINMRVSNKGALNFRTTVGTLYKERLDAFGKDYDPLAILIAECRRQGIASTAWVDLFEAAYDRLIEANPQFMPQGGPGKASLGGFPCYAHEEVRRHMLALVDEYATYKPDRVFFCTKSSHIPQNHLNQPHNRASGFNLPVVEKYRELYGVDIRTEPFDPLKMGRIRGEFLIDFLVEARKRLNRAGIEMLAGATTSGKLQPAGPYLCLDWRRMIERGTADGLVMANSRAEYYAFYNQNGQELFDQIHQACRAAGMAFYPYIISSGTHNEIAKKVGFAGLLDYLPRQLVYLHRLGGDAILIHDLDLYSLDRGIRRALWKAAGNRPTLDPTARMGPPQEIPQPNTLDERFPYVVPQGSFEEGNTDFWYAASSWQMEPGSPAANGSFERHVDGRTRPYGWQSDTGGNERLVAGYDWKVMHNDDYSGRSFHGRSSLLLVAQPGAAEEDSRTVSWQTRIPVPDGPLGRQLLRVRAHGESMQGVAEAGMLVDLLDAEGKSFATLEAPCKTEGTFPWSEISVAWDFTTRADALNVKLYLTVAAGKETQGRLWFDGLEIVSPGGNLQQALGHRSGPGAYRGQGFARFAASGGVDLVSVPFRAQTDEKTMLRLAMRAEKPMCVRVVWCGAERRDETFNVTRLWETFELPIAHKGIHPAVHILIRPLEAGTLFLDELRLN